MLYYTLDLYVILYKERKNKSLGSMSIISIEINSSVAFIGGLTGVELERCLLHCPSTVLLDLVTLLAWRNWWRRTRRMSIALMGQDGQLFTVPLIVSQFI